ncbi:DoxX-like family protein [Lysinibacillus sp. 54212]|uniref:DoxX-like family protein n=1 Tax=Lysinibacillus sp. 54212 TaxID=3119829 RepID=UPI002FC9F0A9
MRQKPIYVEIEMNSHIDTLWRYTQQPELHEQWDLRFSSITYNEKLPHDEAQTFTYTTEIMPGISVSGWGVSKGTHEKSNGVRTSSLHFGTEQRLSPIAEGKGYWQYIPNRKAVTFLTQYDYQVRFGFLGKAFDILFRPLMGWATSLSFDVLKRWIEDGERPATQYRRFFSFYSICFLFFFIWLYQGLVPKILYIHPLEIQLLMQLTGKTENIAELAVYGIGAAEIAYAILWLTPVKKNYY